MVNDFEYSVGAVLKENGYQVAAQVGVAGFFIDLAAVRHPLKAGTFLIGIECDGASYHSSRSARDRDRASTKKSSKTSAGRFIASGPPTGSGAEIAKFAGCSGKLKISSAADPAYQMERANLEFSRTETLRQRLTALREQEITPAFPDSPVEKNLLSPDLLEEFIAKRPKTKDEWFEENGATAPRRRRLKAGE